MPTRAFASDPAASVSNSNEGTAEVSQVNLGDPGFDIAWWTITWDLDGTDSYSPGDADGDPVFSHYFYGDSGHQVFITHYITITVGDGHGLTAYTTYAVGVWTDH